MKNLRNLSLWLAFAGLLFACEDDDVIRGSGPVITRTLDLPTVRGFDILGDFDVIITPGDSQTVVVEGQANLLDILSTEVNEGIWDLDFGSNRNVRTTRDITVSITMSDLDLIDVTGDANVSNEGSLELDVLDMNVTGDASISLAGSVDEQRIDITGDANVSNYSLTSRMTNISIAGDADIRVTVTEALDVSIAGEGNVRYRGNPATVNQSISGDGSVSAG